MYNYSDSIDLLINRFPNLKAIYEGDIDNYADLPYIFFESVFEKYIMETIKSNNKEELDNIFQFVEDMLLNGDNELKNLISVAVIESLYYEENFDDINIKCLKFYGDLTRASFAECVS